ncbi:ABC transporter permease (plasmid) [Peteryoungia desertarenae]|uniref:Autoinducer 2 import system permease protein LsrD n=1 Tax=Peteryoungia desertarenae TaxID=1813451 RepID=A0ABX6QTD3_9HYPH|nr:ABC transporter permease [Peteryoungia desertarenae]QLF71854.1 ABC transporter permease [Peteryoungia desertarenae]
MSDIALKPVTSSARRNKDTVRARNRREVWMLLAFLLAIWAVTALLSPRFLNPANLRDILVLAAPLGFVVIGQMIVIIVRGLDLSVASIMATVAVLAIGLGDNVFVIMALGLMLGAAMGAFNGYLVAYRNVTPFLATLATMIVLQGVRFAYTGGAPSGTLPDGLRFLSTGTIAGVPVSLLLLLAVAFCAHWMLERTILGRRFKLYGVNPQAARMTGAPVRFLVVLAFTISGLMAAIGGLVLVGYVGIVDNWTGRGYELDSIAAAVIGGAALTGGKGSVPGALLAALILVSLFNIVVILGMSIELQLVIKGTLIILAAAVYMKRRDN